MSHIETPKLPDVKFNKTGYEIRTDILEMAKSRVTEEFHIKFHGWELTASRDEKTGQIVNAVNMPTFPGIEDVLATAEKMYGFVNAFTKK